jgi:shikimate kinase
VGLPGSGKSTVGRLAAERLGAAFSDLDEIVALAAGRSIADLFASRGEAEFRRLERAAMQGALAAPPHLVAPGAGWVAEPGNLAGAANAFLLYLEVSPETAARRLGRGRGQGGGGPDDSRPLLGDGDPVARLRELAERREAWYRHAGRAIDASGDPATVAALVVAVARRDAGW